MDNDTLLWSVFVVENAMSKTMTNSDDSEEQYFDEFDAEEEEEEVEYSEDSDDDVYEYERELRNEW